MIPNPPAGTILYGYRGSIAHGMHNPDPTSIDDIDLMGVVIPNLAFYFGLEGWGSRGTKEKWEGRYDMVFYEVKKFVSLLEKSNPNVVAFLYMDPKMFVNIQPEGQMLLDNKELFASKAAYHSFTGYAHAQMSKLHRFTYKGYMGKKRKEIVDQFGYDTKHAAHCIRLLRMGIFFLYNGYYQVDRRKAGDVEELLAIKNGEWHMEKVQAEADKLFEAARQARDFSRLPDKADREKINELLIKMVKEAVLL